MRQPMKTIWIHPATFTYRFDEPEKMLETLWVARAGWGYIRRRDLWMQADLPLEDLVRRGYEERKPMSDPRVATCPGCGMYISDIPGAVRSRHIGSCSETGNDERRMEDSMIQEQRVAMFRAKLEAERLRLKQEQEEAEKKERFDKVREDNLARQQSKDRKARMKKETREQIRKR